MSTVPPATRNQLPILPGPDGTTPIERANTPTQDVMTSGSFSEPAAAGKGFCSTISDCVSGLIDAIYGCFSHIIHFFCRNPESPDAPPPSAAAFEHPTISINRARLREVMTISAEVLLHARNTELSDRLTIAIANTTPDDRQCMLDLSQILDIVQTQRRQQDGIRVWPDLAEAITTKRLNEMDDFVRSCREKFERCVRASEQGQIALEAQTSVPPQQLDDRATRDLFVKILTSISNAPDGFLDLQILEQVILPVLIRMRSTPLSQTLPRPIKAEQLPLEICADAELKLYKAFNDMRNWAREKLRQSF